MVKTKTLNNTSFVKKVKYCTLIISILTLAPAILNAKIPKQDTDGDGLYDYYEEFFGTDPNTIDSDNDGYNDYIEIINKYSPIKPLGTKLEIIDSDGDELWNFEEVIWNTDPQNYDTDSDGYPDKVEIINGYDPNGKGRLPGWIKINLKEQVLSYGNGPKLINSFKTSTGKKGYETPTGEFFIINKIKKAWSKQYGLWMPYWMAFTYKGHGIHELPYWPNGYREGSNHLGKPISHGCVRLGIGPAKELYDWAKIGTKVIVVNE